MNNKKALEIVEETIKGLEVIREQQTQAINEIMDDLKELSELWTLRCAECSEEFTQEHYCKATTTNA